MPDDARPVLAEDQEMTESFAHGRLLRLRGVLGSYRLKHVDFVSGVAFSGDGSQVVSCADDGTVKKWETATGREVWSSPRADRPHCSAALSRNGRFALAERSDGSLGLWNVERGCEEASIDAIPGCERSWIRVKALSDDGRAALLATERGACVFWNVTRRKGVALDGIDLGVLRAADFSPDGRLLAIGVLDGLLHLFDGASGKCVYVLPAHREMVLSLAFTRDGRLLLSADARGMIRAWATPSFGRAWETCAASGISAIAASPDSRLILTASWPRESVALWSLNEHREIRAVTTVRQYVRALALSPDGALAAIASMNGLSLWHLTAGKRTVTPPGHGAHVLDVAISADGRLVVSGSSDGTARLWDADASCELAVLEGHASKVSISPDGRLALSVGWRDALWLWDVGERRLVRSHPGVPVFLARAGFSPDGRWAFVLGWENRVEGSEAIMDWSLSAWDVATGAEAPFSPQCCETRHGHARVALAPDGSLELRTAAREELMPRNDGLDGLPLSTFAIETELRERSVEGTPRGWAWTSTCRVLDLATGRVVRELARPTSWLAPAALSPDGTRLCAWTWDDGHALLLYDLSSGEILDHVSLASAQDNGCCVAWSADQTRLAIGTSRGVVLVFDLVDCG